MLLALAIFVIFVTHITTALGQLPTLSFYIHDDTGVTDSSTTNDVVATLWFNFTIYQYTLPSTKVGSIQTSNSNDLYIIDEYNCDIPHNNKVVDETKIMLENNVVDAVVIDKIKLTTASGTWYGLDSICLTDEDLFIWEEYWPAYVDTEIIDVATCTSGKAEQRFCIDNEPNDCEPYKQMFYFDTLRPNEYITNVLYVDATYIVAQFESCEPTIAPTESPHTLSPTQQPITLPTNHPTLLPTISPNVSLPTNHPTQAPNVSSPTISPSKLGIDTTTISPTSASIDGVVMRSSTRMTPQAQATDNSDWKDNKVKNANTVIFNKYVLIALIAVILFLCLCLSIVTVILVMKTLKAKKSARVANKVNKPTNAASSTLTRVESISVNNQRNSSDLECGANDNIDIVEMNTLGEGIMEIQIQAVNNRNVFVDAAMNDEVIMGDDECVTNTTIA